MTKIFALALVTFKEGIRSRSLLGVLVFFLFVCGLNLAVAGFFMRDIGKVTVDMNLGAISFAGLLLVLFLGLNLTTRDVEKKTIQIILSKPISRTEYAWGKYLGIQAFLGVTLLVLLVLSSLNVLLLRHFYGGFFEGFGWSSFSLAALFIYLKLSVLNAIVLFFSSLATSSFITLVFSIGAYIVGSTIEEVMLYLRTQLAADVVSPLGTRFFEIIGYLFPNFAVFDLRLEAAHGLAVSSSQVLFTFGYAAAYIAVMVTLAAWAFSCREFN